MRFKVVINTCYGGFDLSDDALRMLAARRGLSMEETRDEYIYGGTCINGARSCPALIATIERLGEKESSGRHSELEIVELEDKNGLYSINEYDGWESVYTPDSHHWEVALNRVEVEPIRIEIGGE